MERKKPLRRKVGMPKARGRMKARKADKSKRRFAKHRTPALLEWIKEQGCLICAQRPVEPAHVIPRARGSDDVDNVLPLCRWHHDQQEGKNAEFERKYGVNLAEIAKNYTEMWRAA